MIPFSDAAKALPPLPTKQYCPLFDQAMHDVASGRKTVNEALQWLQKEEELSCDSTEQSELPAGLSAW